MKLTASQAALSERIGHQFKNPELLKRALSHPSVSGQAQGNNQRLEFLGDRVLGLVMAHALLDADPEATEGQLAPRYNALVRKETCAEVARSVELGSALVMGRSEMMSGGRRKEALLADALEAVIAAVYLDAGFAQAEAMVKRLWGKRIYEVEEDARDAKTALQEWAQAKGENPPSYSEKCRSGPPHAPKFTIVVRLDSGLSAEGTAGSKRRAQQVAATTLLAQIEGGET